MDKKELENLEKLQELSQSVGGEYLRNLSRETVINNIDALVNSYMDKDHKDLIVLCATIKANLSLFQLLSGVTEQIEAIKELYKDK